MTKYVFGFLLFIFLSFTRVDAQWGSGHELGIRLRHQNFDVIFKQKLSNDRYNRFRVFASEFRKYRTELLSESVGIGLAMGGEKRKTVYEKLELFLGGEIAISLSTVENIENKTPSFFVAPGMGVVAGLQYPLSERFHLSMEAHPNVRAVFLYGKFHDYAFEELSYDILELSLGLLYKF